jgi:hypothetical protein
MLEELSDRAITRLCGWAYYEDAEIYRAARSAAYSRGLRVVTYIGQSDQDVARRLDEIKAVTEAARINEHRHEVRS